VDHGKSTLIAALTGVHPDRLKEEQEREMTIELGFGWMTMPDGGQVGIVDVPGHRDFIENMLAGVAGLDAALLVIAADEGIMPQTREHLAILDLLQIPAGLVVITKIDLAPDPGWLELIEADIRAAVAGTSMQAAEILRVSARTGEGLPSLVQALMDLLRDRPEKPDLGRARLPIDRVFSMSGFGTVVTGTLSDGALAVADDVEVLPGGLSGRVRGLQTHKTKQDRALPGARTAVNISGIPATEIRRGDVLVHPGQYQAVRRLDARLRLLKGASSSLQHGVEVKVFTGASESTAMLRLLGKEQLLPGEEAWIQLELHSPVVAVRGDRYILRRPSPPETLGGGAIVDHEPAGRHKRFDEQVLRSLESLAQGSPRDILLEAALACQAAPIPQIVARSRLEQEAASQALEALLREERLILLEEGTPSTRADLLVMPRPAWESLRHAAMQSVGNYHTSYPLRKGMQREELKSRLHLATRLLQALLRRLSAEGLLEQADAHLRLPGHSIRFDPGQQAKVDGLMRKFAAAPYAPPSLKEIQEEVGEEVVAALVELDQLVFVSGEVLFRRADYEHMKAEIRRALMEKGRITLAEVRDLFNTTRKFAQALLEHLDSSGMTVRDGDFRKLRS
jgi:selenocysteine-specific elongation factor